MKCHKCQQVMTQKIVTSATDAALHIGNYGTWDDEKVWVTKDGKAICYSDDCAHYTTKEWNTAQ